MTQDEIIRMAREAGLHKMIQVKHFVHKVCEIPSEKLQAFASLVAAHEREKWEQALPIAMDAMMLQEREACENACEDYERPRFLSGYEIGYRDGRRECAAAIRARSK